MSRCVDCWPEDGSKPDLELYYNSDWFDNTILAEKGPDHQVATYETPLVVNGKTDPVADRVGVLTISEFLTKNTYIDTFSIILQNGSITFIDDEITTDNSSLWGPNKVLPFRIVSGARDYLFVKGYVVVVTDENNGRILQFYFGKHD